MVKQNRHQTVAQLTTKYNAGPGTNVFEYIIQRTRLKMGLRSSRLTRVPLLTKHHHQLRLHRASEHRHWTMNKWERMSWSDELRFLIHHVDGRVRRFAQQVINRLMMAVLRRVDPVVVEQIMKASDYLNVTVK